jgi:hypothetical protein
MLDDGCKLIIDVLRGKRDDHSGHWDGPLLPSTPIEKNFIIRREESRVVRVGLQLLLLFLVKMQ